MLKARAPTQPLTVTFTQAALNSTLTIGRALYDGRPPAATVAASPGSPPPRGASPDPWSIAMSPKVLRQPGWHPAAALAVLVLMMQSAAALLAMSIHPPGL